MKASALKSVQLLRTATTICDRYELTRTDFNTFLKLGLPVRKINRCWWGWTGNLDRFFESITVGEPVSVDASDVPDDFAE